MPKRCTTGRYTDISTTYQNESRNEPGGAIGMVDTIDETGEILTWARALRDLPPPRKCRSIRLGAGLSLDKVGAALGVSGVTVGRWENGSRSPRGDDLVAYVRLLSQLQAL